MKEYVPHSPDPKQSAVTKTSEPIDENRVISPRLSSMLSTSRSSAEDHGERDDDEDNQGNDF